MWKGKGESGEKRDLFVGFFAINLNTAFVLSIVVVTGELDVLHYGDLMRGVGG